MMKPFLKSILTGASVGSAPFVLLFIPMLIVSVSRNGSNIGQLGAAVFLFVMPFLVVFFVVALASLMIGTPLTLFMARSLESASSYILAGAFCGGALPVIHGIASASGSPSPSIVLLATISGAATARTWWVTARRAFRTQ